MRRLVLLGIVWTALTVGFVSSSAVITCVDRGTCNLLRVVLQDPNDVNEVLQKHPRAQEVDFHGNLLSEFQQPQAAQWKKLNLSYNLLDGDIFSNIRTSYIETVDLKYNRLIRVSVPPSVIDFLADGNQLFHITFEPQSKIQRLILPKNKFDSLKDFTMLRNLQELDLSCNDLSELTVDKLPVSLRKLKLARNHIHIISGVFTLQSLEYLDLSHNFLTTFFQSHIIFPNVQWLYLQYNKIVMWLDVKNVKNTFQVVDLTENDWDCKNLRDVLKIINRNKVIEGSPSSDGNCKRDNHYICCLTVESPYADRLIKYRKQEFEALQKGIDLRKANNSSCSEYKHSPCDTDDDLVYKVARAAIKDTASLAKSNLQELEHTLQLQQNLVNKISANVKSFEADTQRQNDVHSKLVSYIERQYTEALPPEEQSLKGRSNEEVGKLQQLFSYFERENDKIKQLINEEERKNADKLDEIEVIEKEMEDLKYTKDRLMEDVNQRNTTVNSYKARIEALQKQLG